MQVVAGRDGARGPRAVRESSPQHVSPELARLLPSVFQGETKSAVVEITPLRFDARRQQIVLAKRVLVKLLFTGRETGESGRGSFGRAARSREKPVAGGAAGAALHDEPRAPRRFLRAALPGPAAGLRVVAAAARAAGPGAGLPRRARLGRASAPAACSTSTPTRRPSSTDFSSEMAWELVRARDGVRMPLVSARALGRRGHDRLDGTGAPSRRIASTSRGCSRRRTCGCGRRSPRARRARRASRSPAWTRPRRRRPSSTSSCRGRRSPATPSTTT